MEKEIWKPVSINGLYEVSSFGRVRSLRRTILVLNRWGTVNERTKPGKILRLSPGRGSYLLVALYNQEAKVRKSYRVSRLVAEAFIPNPENKRQVNHQDCNKQNNRADNLEWATHKENDDHAIKNKLHPSGEKHGRAKLTALQVEEVRSKYSSGDCTVIQLMRNYNIGETTVYHILNRETWK